MKSSPKFRNLPALVVLMSAIGLLSLGLATASADQKSPVQTFMPAGDQGGLLPSGTFYPPDEKDKGRLKRKKDRLEMEIKTSGLPAGAYTVWWVVFNKPKKCVDGCDVPDLFNPAVEGSVFYATGDIVEDEGDGLGSACFRDTHYVGEYRGAKGMQDIMPINGSGAVIDPKKSEVHLIIKYHGPASGDPVTLHDQVTTLLGSCDSGEANAFVAPPPFGLQCFDPQVVVFPAPGKKGDDDDDDD